MRRFGYGCILKVPLQNDNSQIKCVRLVHEDGTEVEIQYNVWNTKLPLYTVQELTKSLLLVRVENLEKGVLNRLFIEIVDGSTYSVEKIDIPGI